MFDSETVHFLPSGGGGGIWGECVCAGGGGGGSWFKKIRLKRGDRRKYGEINKKFHSSVSVTASVIIRSCQSLSRNSLLVTSAIH